MSSSSSSAGCLFREGGASSSISTATVWTAVLVENVTRDALGNWRFGLSLIFMVWPSAGALFTACVYGEADYKITAAQRPSMFRGIPLRGGARKRTVKV